jgi:hypothetical protein
MRPVILFLAALLPSARAEAPEELLVLWATGVSGHAEPCG